MPFLEFRRVRSEEHTSELQSHDNLVCRLLLEKKKVSTALYPLAIQRFPRVHARGVVAQRVRDREERAQHKRRHGRSGIGLVVFFFNDTATTEIYTLSLHDALPI